MIANEDMIIDAFPGYNELELANFRIDYLSDFVDLTVIAEARLTQSGLEKPLYFTKWLSEQNSVVKEKVRVIEVPLVTSSTSWEREIYTREFLFRYIKENFSKSKFILSDLDEIPSRSQIKRLKEKNGIYHFHTPTYYRKINWQLRDQHIGWSRGVMGQIALNTYPNAGRFSKEIVNVGGDPGAHFSWLGVTDESLWEKSRAAAHAELNRNFWSSKELLDFCNLNRVDHLGRGRNKGCGVFKVIDLNSSEITVAAFNFFPPWADTTPNVPNMGMRYWASMKVTAYVGEGRLAKLTRSKFTPEYYFKSFTFIIFLIVLLETVQSGWSHIKLVIKYMAAKIFRNQG